MHLTLLESATAKAAQILMPFPHRRLCSKGEMRCPPSKLLPCDPQLPFPPNLRTFCHALVFLLKVLRPFPMQTASITPKFLPQVKIIPPLQLCHHRGCKNPLMSAVLPTLMASWGVTDGLAAICSICCICLNFVIGKEFTEHSFLTVGLCCHFFFTHEPHSTALKCESLFVFVQMQWHKAH